jgi:hypothetical protein
MRKSLAVSIVLIGALFGAYFSVVVVGTWAEENKYVYSSPIDYALDYLSDDRYHNLAIEVDYVSGREPDWNAMNFLIERMHEYCDKDHIYIDHNATDVILPMANRYTLSDLIELEEKYRDLYKHGDTAVLYFLYLNGKYVDTTGYSEMKTEVVGLTYSHSSIAIFKDDMKTDNPSITEEDMEKAVLLHEFGHTICLVGIGYQSAQEDPEHPHHSIHEGCIMYYALNTSREAPPLPTDFCEDSKKDIEYIKSRPRDTSDVKLMPWLLLAADLAGSLSLIYYILASPGHKNEDYDMGYQYFDEEIYGDNNYEGHYGQYQYTEYSDRNSGFDAGREMNGENDMMEDDKEGGDNDIPYF